MATTVKSLALKHLNYAKDFYLKDLAQIPDDKLSAPIQGCARTPYDFTYEIVVVNNRVANTLNGKPNEPWPFEDGWATAPEEFKNRETASKEFEASIQAIIEKLESMSDEEAAEEFTPEGRDEPTSAGAQGDFIALHCMYHCAQLNYIQQLCGDMKMHWM